MSISGEDKIIFCELRDIPDWLDPLNPPMKRLSFFFDREKDNHHTQFHKDIRRKDLVKQLIALAKLIERGGVYDPD